jgi:hypothetical protein
MQVFLQSQMIWRMGQYRVEMVIHNRNRAVTDLLTLAFELSEEDIVLLQANCSNMPKLLKNMCLTEQEREAACAFRVALVEKRSQCNYDLLTRP